MNGTEWRNWQSNFQIGCSVLSFLLNLLLIRLVFARSPKSLGVYKYLLIFVSCLEMSYSFVDIIVSPIIHSSETVVLVITVVKDAYFNPQVMLILTTVYCGFFGCSMAVFAVLFVYRYYVISGNTKIKTFTSCRLIFWFLCVFLSGFVWSTLGYYTCGPTKEIDDAIRMDLFLKLDLNVSDVTYLGPHFYLKNKEGEKVYDWTSISGMNGFCTIVGVTCSIIIFYGRKWYKQTRKFIEESQSSEKYRNIQNQLFYALVLQTIIPVVLLHFPITILFFCAFFDINVGLLAGINTFTIALFPVLDPLPTLFIVENYRKALFNCCCPRKSVIAPISIT